MEKYNVLIADDEEEIRDILGFYVKSKLNCNIHFATNGQEAIDIISRENCDLIICDYNMPLKNGGEVYKHLISSKNSCKYVMCSSDEPEQHEEFKDKSSFFGYIQKPEVIKGFKSILEKIILENSFVKAPEDKSYTPIGLRLLLGLSNMPSEVFVGLTENKYLKIFEKGAVFDETDYIKYTQKGIDKLYVLNLTTSQFIEKINDAIIKVMNEIEPEKKLESGIHVLKVISSTFKDYGFNEALLPAIEINLKEALDMCKSEKTVALLLDKLLKLKDCYIGQHSFLMAAVTVALAEKLEWTSAQTAQKLVISSLFHDIFLKESITNELGMMTGKISDENFLTHSQKAADLLDKMPRIPPDTSRIILEHHEQGEDIGFPRAIDISKTTPLSQLFSFSHYLVDILLEMHEHGSFEIEAFYARMQTISKKSSKYEKLFTVLKEAELFKA